MREKSASITYSKMKLCFFKVETLDACIRPFLKIQSHIDNVGNIGSIDNVGNVGNLGNIGNIGNSGNVGISGNVCSSGKVYTR